MIKKVVSMVFLAMILVGGGDMTEKSYPWQGVAPADGDDAGNYDANEWWAAWAAMNRAGGIVVEDVATPLRTLAAYTNVGVIYAVPNQLEVTDNGGVEVEMDTGAALVDGAFYYNDTALTITLPINVANGYVVLRKNFTGIDYVPASGSGTVPAYTTRPTWVAAITQSTDRTTYWDIPLAKFTTNAADITDLSDEREYVDAETKRIFIPCVSAWNETDGTAITPGLSASGTIADQQGFPLPDTKLSHGIGFGIIPKDFISDASITAVLSANATGDLYFRSYIYYSACSEAFNLHSSGVAYSTTTIGTADRNDCIEENDLLVASVDDIFRILLTRDATVGSPDTIADDVGIAGWYLEYFGWR